jgi:hypothetical protein
LSHLSVLLAAGNPNSNDWVLKIVYRTASAAYDVAGLEGVDMQHDQLVNVDLSHLISGRCAISLAGLKIKSRP